MPGLKKTAKQVISASRRTDIPAFYMDGFMDNLERGYIDVENPYNKKTFRVVVNPNNTHTLVFWSKNFGPFLDGRYGETLMEKGYHLYFNFTVNSHDNVLEPHVPGLDKRLAQLRELARRFGPRSVLWRFDPICHYRDESGQLKDNLADFSLIAGEAKRAGIPRCVTSFVDLYRKVTARQSSGSSIVLTDIPMEQKKDIIMSLEARLSLLGIRLELCCEKDLLACLPPESSALGASCIPSTDLIELYGPGISRAKDKGQRAQKGCGCGVSRDIGSYRLQPCFHNCLFCYANPSEPGGL